METTDGAHLVPQPRYGPYMVINGRIWFKYGDHGHDMLHVWYAPSVYGDDTLFKPTIW